MQNYIWFYKPLKVLIFLNSDNQWWNSVWEGWESVLAAPLKLWQGGKSAPRIISHHANVVFMWVAPQPPCHGLKDPIYAMDKRVKISENAVYFAIIILLWVLALAGFFIPTLVYAIMLPRRKKLAVRQRSFSMDAVTRMILSQISDPLPS